jgi:hypothetical protein
MKLRSKPTCSPYTPLLKPRVQVTVQNLAQRSAKAAYESAELIERSSQNVQRNVKSFGDSETAFRQVSTEIEKIQTSTQKILDSNHEHSTGELSIKNNCFENLGPNTRTRHEAKEYTDTLRYC